MSSFLVRRLVRLAVVITGVSLVTFAILHASGDPVSLIMPEAPEADRAALRRTLGLDDPLPVQFARFFGNAATGNFGNSFFHRTPAFGLVVERMPTTLLLTATLRTFTAPLLLRIVRSSMLDVVGLDYVRTARAKGVSEWLVICRHALKNAALPLVTVTGLQFGLLLGGAVITETVFAVPGVGRLIVGAIRQLDFPVVQAGVFMLAMIVVSVNFLVDVLYLYLNPQIRVR